MNNINFKVMHFNFFTYRYTDQKNEIVHFEIVFYLNTIHKKGPVICNKNWIILLVECVPVSQKSGALALCRTCADLDLSTFSSYSTFHSLKGLSHKMSSIYKTYNKSACDALKVLLVYLFKHGLYLACFYKAFFQTWIL